MSEITQLGFSQLNGDALVVQLLRAEDMAAAEPTLKPSAVRIVWPAQPTIVKAPEFSETAAVLYRLFAGASIELSRISARKYL